VISDTIMFLPVCAHNIIIIIDGSIEEHGINGKRAVKQKYRLYCIKLLTWNLNKYMRFIYYIVTFQDELIKIDL